MKHLILLFVIFFSSNLLAQENANENLRKGGDASRFREYSEEKTSASFVQIRSAVLELRWKSAWKIVQKQEFSKLSLSKRYLYGRVAFENQEYSVAKDLMSSRSLRSDVLLGSDAKMWAAKSAFALGKFSEASGLLAELSLGNQSKKNTFLFSNALIAQGDLERGIRALKAGIKLGHRSSKAPDYLVDIGNRLLKKGKKAEAILAWRYALIEFPGNANSRKIPAIFETKKESFSEEERARFSTFSESERLKIGRTLFDEHLNKRALKKLNGLEKAKDKKVRCEALYLNGRTLTKLRDHKGAIPWYEKAIKQCGKKNVFYRKSLYQLGRSQWNASQGGLALQTFKKLEEEFKGHSYADDAMLYRGRILREQGKEKEARAVFQEQLKEYPKGDMAADAQWYLFHGPFAAGRYKKALALSKNFKPVGDEYSEARLPYFIARSSQLAKLDKALVIEAYEKVVRKFPLSYYALLSFQRLAELSPKKAKCTGKECALWKTSKFEEIRLSSKLRDQFFYRKGSELTRLGLSDEAQRAYRELRKTTSKKDLWGLAAVLDSAGVFSVSHDIARRRTGNWEKSYPGTEAHQRWKISYPQPFLKEVSKFTKEVGLDEDIVYAIMREESGYNPQIRSWAGARGLLQLMPSTAKVVARNAGVNLTKANRLLEPKNAIQIGSHYMDDLSDKSSAHPAFIIAGYNGGWGNLSRWLRQTKTDELDLFVEEIPYGQTRNYTKRVLRSYWAYKIIYDQKRVPNIKMKISDQRKAVKK